MEGKSSYDVVIQLMISSLAPSNPCIPSASGLFCRVEIITTAEHCEYEEIRCRRSLSAHNPYLHGVQLTGYEAPHSLEDIKSKLDKRLTKLNKTHEQALE